MLKYEITGNKFKMNDTVRVKRYKAKYIVIHYILDLNNDFMYWIKQLDNNAIYQLKEYELIKSKP
jgi:hypothetical protein